MKKLLFALSAVLLVFSTCSMSHEWVVLLPNEELCYPFGPNEHLSDHFFGREDHILPKVFRHMYAKQKALLPLTSSGEPVPPLFESPTLMDVTDTAHRQMVRLTRIIELIGMYVKCPLSPKRVAFAMNRLGYRQRRVGGVRGYNVIILTGNDIKEQQRLNARESTINE